MTSLCVPLFLAIGLAPGTKAPERSLSVMLTASGVDSLNGLVVEARSERDPEQVVRHVIEEERTVILRLPKGESSVAGGRQPKEPPDNWFLSCSGERFWCPTVEAGPEVTSLALPVEPGIRLEASLENQMADGPLSGVLQGWVGKGMAALDTKARFAVDVEPVGSRLEVVVPKARLTLRLAFRDYAPIYLWDLELDQIQEGRFQVGKVSLERGSVLTGLVWDGLEDLPAEGVRVSLFRGLNGRTLLPSKVATTNAHGFFSISGLESGPYAIELEKKGRAREIVGPFNLPTDEEVFLERMVIRQPFTVDFVVEPGRRPDDEPWRILLDSQIDGTVRHVASPVDEGLYRIEDVDPGPYYLSVGDEKDERKLLSESLEIVGDELKTLILPVIAIRGLVRLEGEPLEARLFVNGGKGESSQFTSDDAGSFEGWIADPRPFPIWITVEAQEPSFERKIRFEDYEVRERDLELEIDLHDYQVEGIVVDEKGEPVSGARVALSVKGGGAGRLTSGGTSSGADGRFVFGGLDEGEYSLFAEHWELGSSPEVPAHVTPGGTSEVVLELEGGRILAGRLRDKSGNPLGFEGLKWTFPSGRMQQVRTDPAGRFDLRVPPGVHQAAVTFQSARYPLWASCRFLPEDGEVLVEVPLSLGGTLEVGEERVGAGRAEEEGSEPHDVRLVRPGDPVPYVLTEGGALLSSTSLFRWNQQSRGVLDPKTARFYNLAPGRYALIQGPLGWSSAALCGTAPGASLPWVSLAPGETRRLMAQQLSP